MSRTDPELVSYAWLLLLAIVLSVAGVMIGLVSGYPCEAGRGGAASVVVSFFFLFWSHAYGNQILKEYKDAQDELGEEPEDIDERLTNLSDEFEVWTAKLVEDENGQRRQNLFLAWAAGIGTAFWGFGDLLANGIAILFNMGLCAG